MMMIRPGGPGLPGPGRVPLEKLLLVLLAVKKMLIMMILPGGPTGHSDGPRTWVPVPLVRVLVL